MRWLTRVYINTWKQSYSKTELQQGSSGQEIEGGGLQQSGSIFCGRGVFLVLFSLLDIHLSGSWSTWWKCSVFQRGLYDKWREASQNQKVSCPASARGCKRRSSEVNILSFHKKHLQIKDGTCKTSHHAWGHEDKLKQTGWKYKRLEVWRHFRALTSSWLPFRPAWLRPL